MNNIEELKKAAMRATQGEWWQDVVETEGTHIMSSGCEPDDVKTILNL